MFRSELRATLKLGLPLAAGTAGNTLLSMVDAMVAGRMSSQALAATGLGGALYFAGTILGMGLVMGLEPLVAQARGRGDDAAARRHFGEGLLLATAMGLPTFGAIFAVAHLALPAVGTPPDTVDAVLDYLLGRAPSCLPFLWFTALRGYLQAVDRAGAVLWATVVGNLVNLPADLVLGPGDAGLAALDLPTVGFEGLGIFGIGAASTLVTLAQAGTLYLVLRGLPRPVGWRAPSWAGARAIVTMGWPIGLHFAAEMGIFATVTTLTGGMGDVVAGGHQVALQLASFTFTVCLGVAQATTVRVGHALGAGVPPRARAAGQAGLVASVGWMTLTATVMLLFPEFFAGLVARDPAVIAAAVPLLRIAGLFQIFDGAQVVAAGALRGAGDTRAAFRLSVAAYWGVGIPIGLALAYGLDLQAQGLWWGLVAGLAAASVVLSRRFLTRTAPRERVGGHPGVD